MGQVARGRPPATGAEPTSTEPTSTELGTGPASTETDEVTGPAPPAGPDPEDHDPGSAGEPGPRPTPGRGARLGRAVDLGWRGARSLPARMARAWRERLQVRVVAMTVLLCGAVIGVLGAYLYNEIANSLTANRVTSAMQEARVLTNQAQATWDESTAASVDELNIAAGEIMDRYLRPPGPVASRYVIMTRTEGNQSPTILATLESGEVPVSALSPQLRQAVAQDPAQQRTQIMEIHVDGGEVPAVVVGQVIEVPTAGQYDLYYIFPMAEEQQTMGLLYNAGTIAGLILTVLVGLIAWVVTRYVVTPVRRAAEVSQRLASGKLNERLPARGEDDLARLGTSFNAMADSLQTQIRQLEGLSRVQQRFVSDVSHELRTPLTTIRMAVDLIHASRDDFDPAVRRSAELLQGELDRFEALLADLLEISRFDAGAAILELEVVDLRAAVERVVEAAGPIAEARGSTIRVHSDGPVRAEVDERRVERILRNLVVNAVEHGEGGDVDVDLKAADGAVAVVVRDEGVGLKPGEASMVFTRFWRADPARARTTGGTGLGLAIAHEDALLHHGWLQAWGEPGNGSRFRLTLPQRADGTLTGSPLPLAREEG